MTAVEPARWLLGTGPDYEKFMVRWMADHPGDWYRCPTCRNWRLGGKPETDPDKPERCAQCPAKPKPPKRATGWARRGAGYDDASFAAGPYGKDDDR